MAILEILAKELERLESVVNAADQDFPIPVSLVNRIRELDRAIKREVTKAEYEAWLDTISPSMDEIESRGLELV